MHRRRLLLLSLITVVLAVLTAIMLMVQPGDGASPVWVKAPYPTPALNAKQAYEHVATWMDTWAEDGELVTASLSLVKDEERNAPWSFLIYSRKRKRVAVVTLMGSELTVLREQPAVYPQTGVDPEQWVLDSDAVLELWWQRGGNVAWTQSEARSLHLRLGTEAGTAVWRISVLDPYGESLGFWGMQVDSGQPLSD